MINIELSPNSYRTLNYIEKESEYLYNEDFRNLETGDFILTSSEDWRGILVRLFTSSSITHVGIIIKVDENGNIVYGKNVNYKRILILECISVMKFNYYKNKITNGIGIYDFQYLSNQTVYHKVSRQFFKDRFTNENIFGFLEKYKDIPISNSQKFINVWLGINMNNEDEIICSEFCYKLYKYIFPEVHDDIINDSLIHPEDFRNDYDFLHRGETMIFRKSKIETSLTVIVSIVLIIIVIISFILFFVT